MNRNNENQSKEAYIELTNIHIFHIQIVDNLVSTRKCQKSLSIQFRTGIFCKRNSPKHWPHCHIPLSGLQLTYEHFIASSLLHSSTIRFRAQVAQEAGKSDKLQSTDQSHHFCCCCYYYFIFILIILTTNNKTNLLCKIRNKQISRLFLVFFFIICVRIFASMFYLLYSHLTKIHWLEFYCKLQDNSIYLNLLLLLVLVLLLAIGSAAVLAAPIYV